MDEHIPPYKKKRLIKAQAQTNPYYGKPPHERTIPELIQTGVINLDKPAGPTSHQVTAWVQEILQSNKIAHGGTLDPNVTGVLPIALESATKAIGILHHVAKEYICVMKIHKKIPEEKIREACNSFIGIIQQIPPREAAVKIEKRLRKIYYLDILEIKGQRVLYRVGCQAGTYIRTLCTDIGKHLTVGAHMEELRRVQSGLFNEKASHTLQDILDNYLFWKEHDTPGIKNIIQPMEVLLHHLPTIVVRDSAIDALCHGANLAMPGVLQADIGINKDDTIAILSLKGEGVALAQAVMSTRDIIEKDTGIVADITRVLMNKGTYPSIWKT